ncbi:hypothetical protein Golomagni_05071 [Golovinomyces magnicellulatus]|nr:hypothetical protein Golomagni_05071 [Golovinomyces magnicellulatus]
MNEFSPYKRNVSTINDSYYYSNSKKFDHPSNHHTIKRYHVNNGEIEETQNTIQPSRLNDAIYFEQKEAKHPSKNLKMDTVHHPFIIHDLHESQINVNQVRSKSTVRDTYHEFEARKNLEELQIKRDDCEKKSNTEKQRKEGHSIKVNLEPSRLDISQELEIPQKSFTSSSHGYRAGEKQEVDCCGRKYNNRPEQEHSRKESEKIQFSNSTRDLIGGIIAGAGFSAMLANHHEKVGKGPKDPTKNILGGAALGAVGAEVLNRARNQYHHTHTDGGGLKSTSKNSHTKIKSALGLAAASLAAAAVANQYSHAHKVKNNRIKKGHDSSPSKSKALKSRDKKYNSCSVEGSIHKDSKNLSKLIHNSEQSFVIDCGAVENRRSRSRSRSRSQTMTDSETIGTRLAGAAANLLERCKTPEEIERDNVYFGRESRRHSRHGTRSSVKARDKNSFSGQSPYFESELIEYGSDPIYLTDTSLPHTKKVDSASIPDVYSKLKSRNYNHQRGDSSSDTLNLNRTKTRSRDEFVVNSARGIN